LGFPSVETFGDNEIIDVDATGHDCVLIRRCVFEKFPEYSWNEKQGEDMNLCVKARQAGMRVKIHCGIKTHHVLEEDVKIDNDKRF